jgi:hypothetical protein
MFQSEMNFLLITKLEVFLYIRTFLIKNSANISRFKGRHKIAHLKGLAVGLGILKSDSPTRIACSKTLSTLISFSEEHSR